MTSRGELDYFQQSFLRNRSDVELEKLLPTDLLTISCARGAVTGRYQRSFILQPEALLLGRQLEHADDVATTHVRAINVQAARAVPADELAPRAGRGGEHAGIPEAHWE